MELLQPRRFSPMFWWCAGGAAWGIVVKTVVTMTPERWRQIEEVYHAALEREPEMRDAHVEEKCGGDESLIREVKSLLAREASNPNALLNQPSLRAGGFPSLARGARLGPYEIEAPLGSGGMGEVYLARDTKLKRQVAFKVLPDAFAADPERMARFEREACLLASLNHPNIAQIYGVESGGLAMELVNGESPKGPMPFAEAWKIAAQIAQALEYAHEKGIVHRDLKPANIKITPEGVVKLLDFGLAKAFPGNRASSENGNASSKPTPDATMPGVILGTGAYMPPEQALGKSVDQRADIWAFGVILYELLTGRRPFPGEDLPQVIAAVIGQPPDLTPVPPRVRTLVERCLEKDPRKRLRHIGDAGLLLVDETAWPTRTPRSALLMGALAIVAVGLAVYSFVHDRGAPPSLQQARMSVLLPQKSRVQSLAVSPDGREIAMVLVKDGKQQIWVRPLDALEATPLAGTDNAANPFWSPDSRYIAFFADARLRKVGHSGGPVQTLCDALGALGGTWNRNGDILLGSLTRVEKVSAAGGNLSPLPKHPARTELYPVFLPDGRHFLATRANNSRPEPGVWLSATDGPESRRILPDVSNVAVVEPPSGSRVGQVLFTRAGTLMALPFDMQQLKAVGDPFPVAHSIAASSGIHWLAAASSGGVLAYVSGQHGANQYVWRDRQGKVLGVESDAGNAVAISPDGKRLTGDRHGQTWVLEFGRGIATQLTFGRGATNPSGHPTAAMSPTGMAAWASTGSWRMAPAWKNHCSGPRI